MINGHVDYFMVALGWVAFIAMALAVPLIVVVMARRFVPNLMGQLGSWLEEMNNEDLYKTTERYRRSFIRRLSFWLSDPCYIFILALLGVSCKLWTYEAAAYLATCHFVLEKTLYIDYWRSCRKHQSKT